MPVYKDSKGKWFFKTTVREITKEDGTHPRISGYPTLNTKESALLLERQRIQQAIEDFKNPQPRKDLPRLRDLAEQWEKHARVTYSPSTFLGHHQRLESYILSTFGDLRIHQVNLTHTDQIKADHAGKKPKTINSYLQTLLLVVNYGAKLGYRDPLRVARLKIPEQAYREYNAQEIDRILDCCRNEKERCAILLACDAGLRAGEIRALQRADIQAGGIRVIRSDWKGQIKATKSEKARTVPMTNRLREIVEDVLASHTAPGVLVRQDGSMWTEEVMRCLIRRLTRQADVPNRGWHAFRHAFCSLLANRGIPARQIQALAGHSTIQITERYMHCAPGVLESAVSVLDPGPNLASTARNPVMEPGKDTVCKLSATHQDVDNVLNLQEYSRK